MMSDKVWGNEGGRGGRGSSPPGESPVCVVSCCIKCTRCLTLSRVRPVRADAAAAHAEAPLIPCGRLHSVATPRANGNTGIQPEMGPGEAPPPLTPILSLLHFDCTIVCIGRVEQ